MKVYIHFLFLVFLSVLMAGCTGTQDRLEYNIENSSGTTMASGSISLKDSDNIAYINELSGSVMIDTVNATKGAIIRENSIVITGSGAEAEIIFADNSIVRLSPNSRLQISQKGTDNTTLDLQEGGLWARILKPFTDASFFTLETDDLSAGVRGTSIWLITNSGGTDIGIVDTTSTGGQSSGANISIVDRVYYGSGYLHLSEEDTLKVRHSKPLEHKKMKLREQIKMHPFVGINTIRDIRYMQDLIKTQNIQTGTLDRIRSEMEVTMPDSDESTIFIADPVIKSQIEDQDSHELTPTEFIRYLDIDEKIENIIDSNISETDKDTAIEEIREPLIDIPTSVSPVPKNTVTPSQPRKVVPVVTPAPKITTVSSVSGEKKISCTNSISGEPCR